MKPLNQEWAALQKNTRFLLCSDDNQVAMQLGAALSELGVLAQEIPAADTMATRIAAIRHRAVFLDFAPESGQKNKLAHSTELGHLMARSAPDLPRVDVGRYSEPQGAVAALRAGVNDFIDLNAIDEVDRKSTSLNSSP